MSWMKERLLSLLQQILNDRGLNSTRVTLQHPKNPDHGDFSTNAALILAKDARMNPRQLAEEIQRTLLEQDTDKLFTAIDIAGPGFLNFKIQQSAVSDQLSVILQAGDAFGRQSSGQGQRALVEFVSANPTGPLNIGHGRGAMLGDTLSNILEWNGYAVTREYYFNNAGRQMRKLGESVYCRYAQLCGSDIDFPEDGYQGHYIKDIAESLRSKYDNSLLKSPDDPRFRQTAEDVIFTEIKESLAQLGVHFDSFFNEKDLYENGDIAATLGKLEKKELIYNQEGATWLRATSLGRDADKVLVKSSGEPTYRLPDMAYHINKVERGFDLIVDVFGADHIDTYPDVLAVVKSLGYDREKIRVLIHQFVTILRSGEQVKMSTRKANFVTLEDLIAEVGSDVVRYFFLMRGMNTHLNFDLNLALDQSDENPVFYLQYAYARVCNIGRHAIAQGLDGSKGADLSLLKEPEEIQLVQKLLNFPDVVARCLNTLEPQNITNYLQELAGQFHRYYAHHRVVTENKGLSLARLDLAAAVRIVFKNGLTILGINAPEKM